MYPGSSQVDSCLKCSLLVRINLITSHFVESSECYLFSTVSDVPVRENIITQTLGCLFWTYLPKKKSSYTYLILNCFFKWEMTTDLKKNWIIDWP